MVADILAKIRAAPAAHGLWRHNYTARADPPGTAHTFSDSAQAGESRRDPGYAVRCL